MKEAWEDVGLSAEARRALTSLLEYGWHGRLRASLITTLASVFNKDSFFQVRLHA